MNYTYPTKILLAWSEAIAGNKAILTYLLQSEYQELGIFVYALHLKKDARKWLLSNNFPHLMAVVMGAEGDEKAIAWLDKNQHFALAHVARLGDGEKISLEWLVANNQQELARVGLKIKEVKDYIERKHNDTHSFSFE
jgi:hypothetical protein